MREQVSSHNNTALGSTGLTLKRQPLIEEVMVFSEFKDQEYWLALAGLQEAVMEPAVHLMWSFLSDLILLFHFFPAASLHLSPLPIFPQSFSYSLSSYLFLSLSCLQCLPKPYSALIHPSQHTPAHFPCGRLTGRFIHPQVGHITPLWTSERSKRVDVPRVLKSECVPAV